jgi:hypothetical protein
MSPRRGHKATGPRCRAPAKDDQRAFDLIAEAPLPAIAWPRTMLATRDPNRPRMRFSVADAIAWGTHRQPNARGGCEGPSLARIYVLFSRRRLTFDSIKVIPRAALSSDSASATLRIWFRSGLYRYFFRNATTLSCRSAACSPALRMMKALQSAPCFWLLHSRQAGTTFPHASRPRSVRLMGIRWS